ncbi:unnamed protein product [Vitrella brassicaformis CCMP3155]|uniref:Tubulin--tyrosine ligase-like protein 5 n=2 Tax=Vitrella brassicaformis TaxID=1169539 RepID=A0A0G4EAN7_VITBC|nr:unnamed protein product [Vitrella brassicaformis CCMP3155]|eukprot:CEL92347.1 unnamed protein product [Vitrella brassicaformis CCMP3155]
MSVRESQSVRGTSVRSEREQHKRAFSPPLAEQETSPLQPTTIATRGLSVLSQLLSGHLHSGDLLVDGKYPGGADRILSAPDSEWDQNLGRLYFSTCALVANPSDGRKRKNSGSGPAGSSTLAASIFGSVQQASSVLGAYSTAATNALVAANNSSSLIKFDPVPIYVDPEYHHEDLVKTSNLPPPSCLPVFKIYHADAPLVRENFIHNGFTQTEGHDWQILWAGSVLRDTIYEQMNEHQKVNHFPGSTELTRKDRLWCSFAAMRRYYGDEVFDFLPESYILPEQYDLFVAAYHWYSGVGSPTNSPISSRQQNTQLWIVKPTCSSRGRGIFLLRDLRELPGREEGCIVSRYIDNPYLIQDLKFDLRVYVLVTGFDPLRVYVYKEGLTRFASSRYTCGDLSRFKHLTNYAVNKNAAHYVANKDSRVDNIGHKWSLTALNKHLRYMGVDMHSVWRKVMDVIMKTLLSIEHTVIEKSKTTVPYKSNCFELYGFDILLDSNLKPWLMEVNLSPSLQADTPLDRKVKGQLLSDALNVVGVTAIDRRALNEARHKARMRKIHQTKTTRKPAERKDSSDRSDRDGGATSPWDTVVAGGGNGNGCSPDSEPPPRKPIWTASRAKLNKLGKKLTIHDLTSRQLKVLQSLLEEFRRAKNFIRLYPTRVSVKRYRLLFSDQAQFTHLMSAVLYPETAIDLSRLAASSHSSPSLPRHSLPRAFSTPHCLATPIRSRDGQQTDQGEDSPSPPVFQTAKKTAWAEDTATSRDGRDRPGGGYRYDAPEEGGEEEGNVTVRRCHNGFPPSLFSQSTSQGGEDDGPLFRWNTTTTTTTSNNNNNNKNSSSSSSRSNANIPASDGAPAPAQFFTRRTERQTVQPLSSSFSLQPPSPFDTSSPCNEEQTPQSHRLSTAQTHIAAGTQGEGGAHRPTTAAAAWHAGASDSQQDSQGAERQPISLTTSGKEPLNRQPAQLFSHAPVNQGHQGQLSAIDGQQGEASGREGDTTARASPTNQLIIAELMSRFDLLPPAPTLSATRSTKAAQKRAERSRHTARPTTAPEKKSQGACTSPPLLDLTAHGGTATSPRHRRQGTCVSGNSSPRPSSPMSQPNGGSTPPASRAAVLFVGRLLLMEYLERVGLGVEGLDVNSRGALARSPLLKRLVMSTQGLRHVSDGRLSKELPESVRRRLQLSRPYLEQIQGVQSALRHFVAAWAKSALQGCPAAPPLTPTLTALRLYPSPHMSFLLNSPGQTEREGSDDMEDGEADQESDTGTGGTGYGNGGGAGSQELAEKPLLKYLPYRIAASTDVQALLQSLRFMAAGQLEDRIVQLLSSYPFVFTPSSSSAANNWSPSTPRPQSTVHMSLKGSKQTASPFNETNDSCEDVLMVMKHFFPEGLQRIASSQDVCPPSPQSAAEREKDKWRNGLRRSPPLGSRGKGGKGKLPLGPLSELLWVAYGGDGDKETANYAPLLPKKGRKKSRRDLMPALPPCPEGVEVDFDKDSRKVDLRLAGGLDMSTTAAAAAAAAPAPGAGAEARDSVLTRTSRAAPSNSTPNLGVQNMNPSLSLSQLPGSFRSLSINYALDAPLPLPSQYAPVPPSMSFQPWSSLGGHGSSHLPTPHLTPAPSANAFLSPGEPPDTNMMQYMGSRGVAHSSYVQDNVMDVARDQQLPLQHEHSTSAFLVQHSTPFLPPHSHQQHKLNMLPSGPELSLASTTEHKHKQQASGILTSPSNQLPLSPSGPQHAQAKPKLHQAALTHSPSPATNPLLPPSYPSFSPYMHLQHHLRPFPPPRPHHFGAPAARLVNYHTGNATYPPVEREGTTKRPIAQHGHVEAAYPPVWPPHHPNMPSYTPHPYQAAYMPSPFHFHFHTGPAHHNQPS